MEKPASSSNINNGCNTRPCDDTEICVPTSSTSAPSHVCLPLPLQCSFPDAVSHGNVNVSGNSLGGIAHVTCDEGYVASPKGVSVELVCLVTARWTPFVGACQQYEFVANSISIFQARLPWKLELNSSLCVKGIFDGYFIIRFEQTDGSFHFAFRHGNQTNNALVWNVMDGRHYVGRVKLEDKPLLPGDHFNVTIRLLNDTLQLVLNEANTYSIPLNDIRRDNGSQVDFGRMEGLKINRLPTYVNLIAGC